MLSVMRPQGQVMEEDFATHLARIRVSFPALSDDWPRLSPAVFVSAVLLFSVNVELGRAPEHHVTGATAQELFGVLPCNWLIVRTAIHSFPRFTATTFRFGLLPPCGRHPVLTVVRLLVALQSSLCAESPRTELAHNDRAAAAAGPRGVRAVRAGRVSLGNRRGIIWKAAGIPYSIRRRRRLATARLLVVEQGLLLAEASPARGAGVRAAVHEVRLAVERLVLRPAGL